MTATIEEPLVRSRERVKAYGEVFTPRYMVEQMIDVVADDVADVDKTVLEPAAGDGNFLVAILERKLRSVEMLVDSALRRRESLFALASIYGIELLEDNHADAKVAMMQTFLDFHRRHGEPCHTRTNLRRAAEFLIDTNVVRGNTLTGLDWRGQGIEFSWWIRDAVDRGVVQRQPFTFASLREVSMFDLAVYESYAPCAIDRVHQGVRSK